MHSNDMGCAPWLDVPAVRPRWRVKLVIALAFTISIGTKAVSAQPQQDKAGHTVNHETSDAKSRAVTTLGNLPLGFEPNRGQWDPNVTYSAREGQYNFFLTSSKAMFLLPEHLVMPPTGATAMVSPGKATTGQSSWDGIGMRLVGGNALSDISASGQLTGRKNYYIGADQKKWASGVPLYARLQAHDVYPGIDLAFRNTQRQLEFDFLVNPGSNPNRIRLAFEGVSTHPN